MAHDARDKGVDIALAPCVNLQRSPYAGRYFEYFSEDPLLTGLLGGAYVRGLQKLGVAATVKHFVANDSETERMTVDVVVDERTLHEIYLLPFELIVRKAKPWLIMSSYNCVNGESMSESPLLRDVLKEEWGFDGLVMSDFLATPPTVAAAASGLDIAMPWPRGEWDDLAGAGRAQRRTGRSGARRQDRPAHASGLPLRGSGGLSREDACAGARQGGRRPWTCEPPPPPASCLCATTGSLLPLDKVLCLRWRSSGRTPAGGANGGGSAKVYPVHVVSPLEGIRGALADSRQCGSPKECGPTTGIR